MVKIKRTPFRVLQGKTEGCSEELTQGRTRTTAIAIQMFTIPIQSISVVGIDGGDSVTRVSRIDEEQCMIRHFLIMESRTPSVLHILNPTLGTVIDGLFLLINSL